MSLVLADHPDEPCLISRLNADLLQLVFEIVADLERPPLNQPTVKGCWMRVGHVCRLWRSLILGLPSLWARDVCAFGVHESFDSILDRAGGAPLHLDFQRDIPDYTLARMAPLISRARILRCIIRSPEDYDSVTSTLNSEQLPHLEVLSIDLDPLIIDLVSKHRVEPNQKCAMRHLQMKDTVVLPPHNGLLTSLVINLFESERVMRFTIQEIVDVLLQNLSLKSLTLNYALRDAEMITNSSRIVLLELAQLTIHQDHGSPFAFELLSLLLVPNATHLDVTDDCTNTPAQVTRALTCAMSSCADSSVLQSPELSLKVLRGWYDKPTPQLDINLCPSQSVGILWSTEAPIRFGLFPDLHHDPLTAHEMLHAALQQLSASKVADRVTQLSWYPWPSEADHDTYWTEVLRSFPNTVSLLVSSSTERFAALFSALSCHELLPNFTQLSVECDQSEDVPQPRAIEHMLRQRLAAGSPICEIRLQNLYGMSRTASVPKITAAEKTMRDLARKLNAAVTVQDWAEVVKGEGILYLGTTFTFVY
ncbi:unnamed protein product [Peniophora sp. CBMAI 1063]|nr:unnamed protein product [Peniophora sp. CBMAI 1063]